MNKEIVIKVHTKSPSKSIERIEEALGLSKKEVIELHYGCAVDKITQYEFFRENKIPHPPWTTSALEANKWIEAGDAVVARTKIKGSKGNGVSIFSSPFSLENDDFKVFTKYKKKKREFRVNIFRDQIVNIREKVQKGSGSKQICSPSNGWSTDHIKKPIWNEEQLREIALEASKVSQSDFIGVDVGFNEFYKNYFVLEVNSGPSIEGSSVKEFAEVIQQFANQSE